MAGHIRRRGKNSWTVVVDLDRDPASGKRRQIWRAVKGPKREAEVLLAQLVLQRETGTGLPPDRLTVAQFLTDWLTLVEAGSAPKTYRTTADIVSKHVIPKLGAVRLIKLRPAQIQTYLAQARLTGRLDGKGGLSARSVQRHYQVLHAAFDRAVTLEMIPRNPTAKVEVPRPERHAFRALAPQELATLLATADETPYGPIVRLAVLTGLRQGELLGLRWDDVDLAEGVLSVQQVLQALPVKGIFFRQPKTQASRRSVALSPDTVMLLRAHRPHQAEERLRLGPAYHDHGLVFQTPLGTPVDPSNLRRDWRKIVARAGIGHIRFHDLRHTHASLMLKQGTHLKVVSERLGHASITITADLYSHVLPGLQAAAAARFDEILNAPAVAHG